MSGVINPAQPDCANTVYIDLSSSSQNVTLKGPGSPFGVGSYLVTSDATATAYIVDKNTTATTPTGGTSILPITAGSIQVLTLANTVSAISSGSVGKLYFTPVVNRQNGGI